ncbi:4870_t:CDS:1 [Cetraspora pellucida]|uniref:4870_t:CDS:1 n=1 Tax=Cetraspora pellucida TaxID=1433469 RepID=A0ACA9N6W8_9GLOM|nr:4870_t:CDS:1 [Cetraspora pellucida]
MISKKLNCPFLVNVSYSRIKNSEELVFVNKVVKDHNHVINREMIKFKESKKFTKEMIDDIKFITVSCKFDATNQRKFLENKYPLHAIYSKDLYAAISKFCPTQNSLLNDVAKISNWLDQQKELDSRWYVA